MLLHLHVSTKRHEGSDRATRICANQAVIGYYIESRDGDLGHVEDFLIDDETWAIRYMDIDTVISN